MFTIPNLQHTSIAKMSSKLSIAYVPQNHIQLATPLTALRSKYVSPPYGMTRSEMGDSDCLSVSVEVHDKEQREYIEKLSSVVDKECRSAFGKGVRPLLVDNLLKFKVPKNCRLVDKDGTPLDLSELRGGAAVVPMLRITSLWSGGGEAGASLKCVKMMVIEQREEADDPEWAF